MVEDDHTFAKVISDYLAGASHTVICANSVSLAQTKLKNQKFDLILLDLHLNHSSGIKIIELLKDDYQDINSETPIILMSGFIDNDILSKYGQRIKGALVKPFDKKALMERINSVLIK